MGQHQGQTQIQTASGLTIQHQSQSQAQIGNKKSDCLKFSVHILFIISVFSSDPKRP